MRENDSYFLFFGNSMHKHLTLLLLISLSGLGCDSLRRDAKTPKKEVVKSETTPDTKEKAVAKIAGPFFFRNEKGESIQKGELRDLGLIAKKMGFTLRQVSGFYNDFHLDGEGKTQLVISEFNGNVSLKILGDALSIANGVNPSMDFKALRNAEPGLKCQTNNDAEGTNVRCKIDKDFDAVFDAESKKLNALKMPVQLDALEKMLGSATILRLEAELKVEKPKKATPRVRQKGVLPAGVFYFRHAYTPCKNTTWSAKGCDVPSVAVVDGIYTEAKARTRLNSIGVGTQYANGYPLVLHTDEIGLKDTSKSGVMIILGLFANGNAAKEWQTKTAPKATIMTLKEPGITTNDPDKVNQKRIVRIRPGASVNGYKDTPFKKDEDMMNPPDKMPEGICKVAAGSFVVTSDNLGYASKPKPAKCKDGKDVVVHYNDTLLNAMIGEDRQSKWKVWQLTYAECDTGYFSSWPMEGRAVKNKRTELINDGGC